MERFQSNIGSVSRRILQNYTKRTRKDGLSFWDFKQDVEWQHHIVMEAYRERMLCPEAYTTIFKLLIEIYIAENREEAEEFLEYIDPYDNVNDLTTWLSSDVKNIAYLNQALETGQYGSGEDLLALAHRLFLQDVGRNLIQAIEEYVNQEALCVRSA